MIDDAVAILIIVVLTLAYVYGLESIKAYNDYVMSKYKSFGERARAEEEMLRMGENRSAGLVLWICKKENANGSIVIDGMNYTCERNGSAKFSVYGVVI